MKLRPKLRTFCRWMLTILTVMLVVVWIGSGWCSLAGSVYGFSDHRKIVVSLAFDKGKCIASIDDGSNHFVDENGMPFPGVCTLATRRIEVEQINESPGFEWDFRKTDDLDYYLWYWDYQEMLSLKWHCFPAWLPLLLLAIPTVLMWRTHLIARRRKPGVCKKCGYDITGVAGMEKCPECGTLLQVEATQARAL